MNAAILWGSVNVWNRLAASVRNSVLSFMVVTLTTAPELLFCDAASGLDVDLLTLELEYTFGVVKPLDGLEPGAC